MTIFLAAWRALHRLWAMVWPWTGAARVWPFNVLLHRTNPSDPTVPSSRPSSASPQLQSNTASSSRPYPRRIRYVPVAGEWQRKFRPHWPESAFKVPDVIPEGYIYYITKGDYVRTGSTALVERLPSGHIAKTPLPNPYSTWREQKNRENLEHEYQVYEFLGSCPFAPRIIEWDEESKVLVLEDCPNGDIETYIREQRERQEKEVSGIDGNTAVAPGLNPETRRKWARQAAQALVHLHRAGITHQDIAPRNFLLTDNLDIKICDFAGSSFPGHSSSAGAPGARYQSKIWGRGYVPTQADDVFGLGSVLYFIMAGEEPCKGLEEEEVEQLFENRKFPVTDHLECGPVIQQCWGGKLASAEDVLEALAASLEQADSI